MILTQRCSDFYKILAFIITTSKFANCDQSRSMLGFCDSEFYVPTSKSECPGGINFDINIPKCVCVKGIYQTVTIDCNQGVGFTEEVCTRTEDEASGRKLTGIRLVGDPNWSDLGLVYFKSNPLIAHPPLYYANEASTNTLPLAGDVFYTINGRAKIYSTTKGGKRIQNICIERNPDKTKDFICLYRHQDNVDTWHLQQVWPYSTKTKIQAQCSVGDMKLMNVNRCFSPLTLLDSDCQVPCEKTNILMETPTSDIWEGTPDMGQNCTTDPQGFFRHENKFIDRQLLTYMVIDQIKNDSVNVTLPPLDVDKLPGIAKAYEIYDIIHDIANRSCSFTYLHLEVWDWASKFFMYLHRASKLKYDIAFTDKDFLWIKDILSSCAENVTTLTLSANDKNPLCPTGKKAYGYCDPVNKGSCDYVPVKLSPMYQDFASKHYVPEIVWLFLDIVHMQCFKEFAESYRMFHVMERVYEQLFTTPIKDYWHYPTWSDQTKNSLMTVDADVIMWNAEMCAESVYKRHHHKLYRLARPLKYSYPSRKRRAAQPITPSYDITCATHDKDFRFPNKCKLKPKPLYPW